MVRILCEGGSEGGGEGEGEELLNDDDCSLKDEDSKEGTIIEVATALPSHLEPKTENDGFIHPEPMLTSTPAIQLSVHDQANILQDAELDADVQQKLLSEIPFKMEDRGEDQNDLQDEPPEPVTTVPIPYADSTTSQPEHIPYLSKQILANPYLDTLQKSLCLLLLVFYCLSSQILSCSRKLRYASRAKTVRRTLIM